MVRLDLGLCGKFLFIDNTSHNKNREGRGTTRAVINMKITRQQ